MAFATDCIVIELLASDPVSPSQGLMWYNTTDKCLRIYDGAVKQTLNAALDNMSATADPTVNDDVTFGYTVGSHWYNVSTDEVFVCLDDSDGAAVWRSTTAAGGMVTGVSKNSGAVVNAANRSVLNFIEGANVTLTVSDDAVGDEVDITIASTASANTHPLELPLSQNSNPYWQSSSDTYEVMGCLIFRGTTTLGTPSAIKAVAWVTSGVTGGIRVYDVTNSQVICENASITNSGKAIISLGSLSNLPAGESLWEVQTKRVSGGGSDKVYTASVSIQF